MLQNLFIKNYALIRELDIAPHKQLNTITGETGAGKSIMLGAVGLLIGKRADTKVLYDEEKKCVVEGVFNLKEYNLTPFFEREELDYETECLIRREISASGKSRAFINDTPVTLDVLKELGSHLMDIHSQHETLLLGNQNFQLQIIDAYANAFKELEAYQTTFKAYTKKKKELDNIRSKANQLQEEADYNQFLFDELAKAELQPEEQEELEESLKTLENGEEIKTKLNESLEVLDRSEFSVLSGLHQAVSAFQTIKGFRKDFDALYERLNSAAIELQDIQQEIDQIENTFEHDPEALQKTQDRLSLIFQLQQKHKVDSISELLEIQQNLESSLMDTQNADEYIERLSKELGELEKSLSDKAKALQNKRKSIFKPLEAELLKHLAGLGMENSTVVVEHKDQEPDIHGIDNINILFSANKGVAPKPLKNVASGGEFSRLMFAIKYIMADKIALPTIVFDEIDTGISGEIALKMVSMMREMSQKHQVITISHLPQIAAKGNHHYFVYKDNSAEKSVSKIKLLAETERQVEIAKMIGGDNPSDSAIESAKELLAV